MSGIQWRVGLLLSMVGLGAGFHPPTQPLPAATPRTSSADTVPTPARFSFGRLATTADISRLNIDVRPDGNGRPGSNPVNPPGGPAVILSKTFFYEKSESPELAGWSRYGRCRYFWSAPATSGRARKR